MGRASLNSFGCRQSIVVGGDAYEIYSLETLAKKLGDLSRLPFSIKVMLENLLRNEDGESVTKEQILALASSSSAIEIAFTPARILMQDFTGVPAMVDLAAMRDAMMRLGGNPERVNPLIPVDLVIDHSVMVDQFASSSAFAANTDLEYQRNRERYTFLRWGQKAFRNFRVVPPGTGICHQVNLEYLANVVQRQGGLLFPDTLVGTDSHTTMINGLGVVGWGVGGIEAEAAMLGQPLTLVIPEVVGFELTGELPAGATATDAVLTITEILRKKGVVGKFVEFFGAGVGHLSLADRATIANMAPEYGATMGFFPVDQQTLDYLALTNRSAKQIQIVEAYTKAQGLFRTDQTPSPRFSETLSLDLSSIEPCLAGPKRPQDRIPLRNAKASWQAYLSSSPAAPISSSPAAPISSSPADAGGGSINIQVHDGSPTTPSGMTTYSLTHGSVVIAAITSCTNTSNPSVMIGAGLLAKKAVEMGLQVKPWVKTSLAPGSKVVVDYLRATGLLPFLEKLGFHLVGYGCTTCIGNSGPLPEPISRTVKEHDLVVAAVLSGNRNFEGRIHSQVKANYLASPPLVVAYALAGHMDFDPTKDSLGKGANGQDVTLKDLWPSTKELEAALQKVSREMFAKEYGVIFEGDAPWTSLPAPEGQIFAWDARSTYVKNPPYFEGMTRQAAPPPPIQNARVLAVLGDSVTTDHISPAGSIPKDSPAGHYLMARGVDPKDFNSYGARRGNDEVMVRGTLANIRLKNLLAPGTEGGRTLHLPDRAPMTLYDASVKYRKENVSLIVIAGKEYGSGSSRDWAAKGPALLGVRAVIAESFERIHRSNLVGMGILPLQFRSGENRAALGLTGEELYSVEGVSAEGPMKKEVRVTVRDPSGKSKIFSALVRIDTPAEAEYYRHGGILPYVLRKIIN